MSNEVLHQAKAAQKDEFYTQLSDIEQELRHYREHFRDKVVFCNCDDPFESSFVKYFALNFNHLGLKKLIATSYVNSPIAGMQLPLFEVATLKQEDKAVPYKIEITEVKDFNQDGATDLLDIEYLLKNHKNTLSVLEGDGDFRSAESIGLLREANIVVTNPPFSLFREFISLLFKHKKHFIVIGPKNAITYKEIFPLLKANLMWIGMRGINQDIWFEVPDYYECEKIENGKRLKHIGACWYTNLDILKRHEELILGGLKVLVQQVY